MFINTSHQIYSFQTTHSLTSHSSNKMGKYSSSTKNPSFFKVLIAADFDEKLRIPPAFMKHFDGKLPCQVILKSPTRKSWTVQVKEIDKDFFFCDGWEAFVNQHSLEFGDFIVFKYYAYSKFRVIIFGPNACEKELNFNHIDTPIPNASKGKEVVGNLELTRKPSVEIERKVREVLGVRKVEMKVEMKKRLNFSGHARNSRKYHMSIPRGFGRETGLFTKTKLMLEDPNGKLWPVKIAVRRDRRLDMTDGWAQFCRGNKVEMGDNFFFEYNGRKFNTICVRVSISRPTVKTVYKDECQSKKTTKLHGSYDKDFAKKNESNQFESKGGMTSNFDDELEVISIHSDSESYDEYGRDDFFDQEEEANGSVCMNFDHKRKVKGRGFEPSKAFVSKYPFCMITMRPSYVSKKFSINIPTHFAKLYLFHEKPSSLILQVPDGRTWYVGTHFAMHARITKGWNQFVLDNNLVEGDVCILELVDMESYEINVTIIRLS